MTSGRRASSLRANQRWRTVSTQRCHRQGWARQWVVLILLISSGMHSSYEASHRLFAVCRSLLFIERPYLDDRVHNCLSGTHACTIAFPGRTLFESKECEHRSPSATLGPSTAGHGRARACCDQHGTLRNCTGQRAHDVSVARPRTLAHPSLLHNIKSTRARVCGSQPRSPAPSLCTYYTSSRLE